jgi:hypothetical protein
MFKPKSLRNALTDAVPVLKANPDMMRIFIDNGKLASPLRVQQADIMTTDEGRKRGFIYEADINNDDSIDLSISLLLTERTIVKEVGAELHIEHAPEPQPPEPVTRPMKLYVHGELVSEWHE